MYRGKIFYPGDDSGILARSLQEFYSKHDPKRAGIEAQVETLMRTWSRGEVARALVGKYGTLPLRWRKYLNEPDPDRSAQVVDPEAEEDGFKAIRRMYEEDKVGDYSCGLEDEQLEEIFKNEDMEDDIDRMWDELGIDAKYNHTLPIEPASLGGSVRAQVVRKDPYRPIGQQDPPYVVGTAPEEETNTGRQIRDEEISKAQSKISSKYGDSHHLGDHPRYPGTGMSSKKSSREMHLVKGANGVIYPHALPRGGGGEARVGGRGFGEKKCAARELAGYSISESVDSQLDRALNKRPGSSSSSRSSLGSQYANERSSARPATFLATLTNPKSKSQGNYNL
jgi:hypothetical protein